VLGVRGQRIEATTQKECVVSDVLAHFSLAIEGMRLQKGIRLDEHLGVGARVASQGGVPILSFREIGRLPLTASLGRSVCYTVFQRERTGEKRGDVTRDFDIALETLYHQIRRICLVVGRR